MLRETGIRGWLGISCWSHIHFFNDDDDHDDVNADELFPISAHCTESVIIDVGQLYIHE